MESATHYIETSIPAGMTISEYRRTRPPKRPTLWARILKGNR